MERYIVIIVAFGYVYFFDYLHVKKKGSKKDMSIYLVLILLSLYMGVDYVMNRDWIDYYDVFEPLFKGTAREIDSFLK
ncbi:hypothetical protein SAMN05216378_1457 [Paenibacillus catalpae]|uniref:Uncharacterized protein n=1 Tax=Paenibacillus catalpae TaxID=1045775 RepID=A0A1I1V9L3_9BACL|nr:hypothetical protein [Paenibacillus catalpae]SFD79515.1 hypothetical protein SAMN05216378_1457 [Paenibacillus catalpae]